MKTAKEIANEIAHAVISDTPTICISDQIRCHAALIIEPILKELNKHTERIRGLYVERDRLVDELKSSEKHLALSSGARDFLAGINSDLLSEIGRQKHQIKDDQGRIDNLKHRVKQLMDERDSLADKLNSIDHGANRIEELTAKVEDRVQRLMDENDSMAASLETSERAQQSLSVACDHTARKNRELKNEIARQQQIINEYEAKDDFLVAGRLTEINVVYQKSQVTIAINPSDSASLVSHLGETVTITKA